MQRQKFGVLFVMTNISYFSNFEKGGGGGGEGARRLFALKKKIIFIFQDL